MRVYQARGECAMPALAQRVGGAGVRSQESGIRDRESGIGWASFLTSGRGTILMAGDIGLIVVSRQCHGLDSMSWTISADGRNERSWREAPARGDAVREPAARIAGGTPALHSLARKPGSAGVSPASWDLLFLRARDNDRARNLRGSRPENRPGRRFVVSENPGAAWIAASRRPSNDSAVEPPSMTVPALSLLSRGQMTEDSHICGAKRR
jgi:hypothetical protein